MSNNNKEKFNKEVFKSGNKVRSNKDLKNYISQNSKLDLKNEIEENKKEEQKKEEQKKEESKKEEPKREETTSKKKKNHSLSIYYL